MLGISMSEGNGCKCGAGEGPFSSKTDDVDYIAGILVVFLRIYWTTMKVCWICAKFVPCLLSEVQAGGTLLQCVPGTSRDTWNGPGIPFKDNHSWWNVDLWLHHRFNDSSFIQAKLQGAVVEVHMVHFTEWLNEWHDRWICCIHFLGDYFKGFYLSNLPTWCTTFYNKFISRLYMFRTPCAHHQEVKIVLYSLWYHHTYKWPSCARDSHL